MTNSSGSNGSSNGQGSQDQSQVETSKTWTHIYEDTWLEDNDEEPGQEKLVESKDLKKELGDEGNDDRN